MAPGDASVSPYSHVLLAGPGYLVGGFSCPPESPLWREENWIGARPHVVVPATPVRIIAAASTVATRNEVLVYDGDTTYWREALNPAGDRCTYLALQDDLRDRLGADEHALLSLDTARGGGRRPAVRVMAAGAQVHAMAIRIRAGLASSSPDLLDVDTDVVELLSAVARSAAGTAAPALAGSPAHRHAVEGVKELLISDPGRPWRLADLGAAVHYSPFFLARIFRARTGMSVSEYRRQLRLRTALDAVLEPGADLARIAADHGFASHSHFTMLFRRAFGYPPSHARNRVDGRRPGPTRSGPDNVDRV